MTILFLWVGVLFAVIGFGIIYSEIASRRDTISINGRVVGFSSGRGMHNKSLSFYSVAEFVSPDGALKYVASTVGSSTPLHAVGQRVDVLVKRNEMNSATFRTSAVFVIGGVLALLGCIGIIIFIKTFETNYWSLGIAAVVTLGLLKPIWQARRKTAMSWDEWQKHKKGILKPTVYEQSQFDEIPWCDPVSVMAAFKSTEQSYRVAIPVLACLTVGSLYGALHLREQTQNFLAASVSTEGRVVEMVESYSSDSTTYAPLVEFIDGNQQVHRFKHSISSSPPSYDIGDKVKVLYIQDAPKNAKIDLGHWNHLFWVGLSVLSACFGLMCLSSIRARGRKYLHHQMQSPLPTRKSS